MVGTYPVDIANGLSNIRLYCNIVGSKTTPLLTDIPMGSLYKNYFYKNRMLILFPTAGSNRVRVEGRERRPTLVHRLYVPADR